MRSTRLPPMPSDAPPRTLMVIGQDASQRLSRRAAIPAGRAFEVGKRCTGRGRIIAERASCALPEDGPTPRPLAHRDRPGHVLPDGLRAARAGVGLRDAPFLLELLLPILDTTTAVLPGDGAAEFDAPIARAWQPCSAPRRVSATGARSSGAAAQEAAIEAAGERGALRSTIEEMRLNPLAGGDFSARLDGTRSARWSSTTLCRTWQGTAHASQRDHLREALAARAGELLEGSWTSCARPSTFRGDCRAPRRIGLLQAERPSLISKVHTKAVREAKRSVPPS